MQLEHLGIDPIRTRFPMERLYVFAGRGSVRALTNTVMGIGSFFLPPVSGRDFGLRYQLNLPEYETAIGDAGRPEHYAPPQVMLQNIQWLPWSIQRQGTYHRRVDGKLISLDIRSELLSPADADGVLERVTLTLRSPATLRVDIRPMLDNPAHAFGVCPPAAWNYEPPAASHQVWSEGPLNWRVDDCRVKLIGEGKGLKAGPRGWSIEMKQDQTVTLYLGLTIHGPGMKPMESDLASHANSARAYWEKQFALVNRKFGKQIDRMDDRQKLLFYRGWVTAMTSRWDRENFIAQPFYAAEGIDGGSVCSYLWDLSYVSHFLSQLEGRTMRGLIETMIDPEKIFIGYSLSPLAHEWLGVFYAFNPYSLIHIVANYVDATGDKAFLTRKVKGQRVIDSLDQILETFDQRYASSKGVLDFGHNRHLIELHTAGYEGLVPNPNYEHVYCWRTMDRLRQLAGLKRRPEDLKRADRLLATSNRLFWNAKQGWHFPAAQRDEAGIWSIQTLSALRLGVYSQEQARAIAENLRDGRFLGPCGVYSIARDDQPHFTLNDVDWGGGGCFTGHVAIILEGLSHYGLDDAIERILSRIAWWGDSLPYIPQQTRADAPVSDGRPNAVAGAAICQALLAMQKV